jgi:hypothetical protein
LPPPDDPTVDQPLLAPDTGADRREDDYDEDDTYPGDVAITPRLDKYGAGAGIAYALLGFFATWLLAVGSITPTDSSETIARHLLDVRGRLSAGVLLTLLSLFFLLVFVAWLHRWLRDIEGERGWLANLALAGGVLMAVAAMIVVVLTLGLTTLDDYGPETVIGRTLLTLQWQAIAIAWVPTALLIGSVSVIGSRSGQLPRWLSVSGTAIAVGLLIPFLAFLPFLVSNLWIGMLALFLLQRSRGRM